jgi:hypothetical protein
VAEEEGEMTETLELACFINCAGGLEIDNADLVISYVEHFDGSVEIKAKSMQLRIADERLARAVERVLKAREKEDV